MSTTTLVVLLPIPFLGCIVSADTMISMAFRLPLLRNSTRPNLGSGNGKSFSSGRLICRAGILHAPLPSGVLPRSMQSLSHAVAVQIDVDELLLILLLPSGRLRGRSGEQFPLS